MSLQPAEGSTVELLIRCAIGEAVGNGDVWEVFEDAALHSQFVQVASLVSSRDGELGSSLRVKQREDALGHLRGFDISHDVRSGSSRKAALVSRERGGGAESLAAFICTKSEQASHEP